MKIKEYFNEVCKSHVSELQSFSTIKEGYEDWKVWKIILSSSLLKGVFHLKCLI